MTKYIKKLLIIITAENTDKLQHSYKPSYERKHLVEYRPDTA